MRTMSENETGGGKIVFKELAGGEALFEEGDEADRLYIIKEGQVRLFKPKGSGFIELGTLRKGEVIGEMSYFELSPKRNCSAAAVVTTQLAEIPFASLDKMMRNQGPWVETIIRTLVARLKKANDALKRVEPDSVQYGKDGKVLTYRFFSTVEVVRTLTALALVAKAHGEGTARGLAVPFGLLAHHLDGIFNVQDIKVKELLVLLGKEGLVDVEMDDNGLFKRVEVLDLDGVRGVAAFIDSQRRLDDVRRTKLSPRCVAVLTEVLAAIKEEGRGGAKVRVDLGPIMQRTEMQLMKMEGADLRGAVEAGLCSDLSIDRGESGLSCVVHLDELLGVFPAIRLLNLIDEANAAKEGKHY